jgi:mRNA interferase RelE/StbE
MSKWVTRFTESARRDLRALPKDAALRILRQLADLETDPYGLATTELVGEPGFRRLRVGSHRVLYTLDLGQIVIRVIAVGHRSTIDDR